MKPLFIVRGMDYTERSAGINVLHRLAEALMDRGEYVCMSPCKLRKGSTLMLLNADRIDGRKLVVIEPEVNGAEQLWADLTVRWLLNKPGKAGPDQSGTWGKDDLLCHFDSLYSMSGSIPLTIPHVDREIFNNDANPDDNDRKLDCFYARKARYYGRRMKCPSHVLDISDSQFSLQDLASLFRKTRTLYAAEMTACSVEAVLCGAKSTFVLNSYMPDAPYIPDFSKWYEDIEARSKTELDNFVNVCYERLGLRSLAAV